MNINPRSSRFYLYTPQKQLKAVLKVAALAVGVGPVCAGPFYLDSRTQQGALCKKDVLNCDRIKGQVVSRDNGVRG